jgi:nucleotide-binding universal stress UspA family protein/MFS family permease/DNA-binding CsgD family transcriptional regulator
MFNRQFRQTRLKGEQMTPAASTKHADMARARMLPSRLRPGPGGERPEPIRPGPLAGRYAPAAVMVVLFLVPYLALSSALLPLTPVIAAQLHVSLQTMSLGYGLANAGYAVGTVLAVQIAQRLPQRRMMVVYAGLLVIGSVLAAAATGPAMFIVGHVLQGLCTSLLLIAATPPLILGYPAAKLRSTAVIFNLCIFGAVAAGPLIGGAQASFHAWRPLFWIVAGIALAALLMSLLTFQDAPPADPSAPRDPAAIGLAATGSVAAFWGAAELLTHRFLDPVAVIPLLAGLALIVALVVYEYRARHPLLILRSLTTTIPVTGIVVAMCAAAAATSATALTATVLAPHYTPLHLGLLFVPELAAAIVTAIVFGAVFSTRLIHYYALTGMAILAAGVLVLRAAVPPNSALTLAGSALVGIGIGASVVPALFLAGYSLRSASIQRVFAILELLRALAAFLIAPILLHFAVTLTGLRSPAMSTALWICFGLSAGGAVAGVLLYLLGRVRPPAPALERWMGGQEPAWESPPLLAALRSGAALPTLARTAAAAAVSGGERLVTVSAGHPRRHAARKREPAGPVLFAYDGSRLAMAAIAEAGRQLPAGRDALVLTVWRTFGVSFIPEPGAQFDAASADEVGKAAEQTAAHGAALAEAAGFRAQPLAVQGTPVGQAVIDAADDHDASLIVLGSHRRAGFGGRVAGSVAADVASHAQRPVLTVHDQPIAQDQNRAGDRTPGQSHSPASADASQAAGNQRPRLVPGPQLPQLYLAWSASLSWRVSPGASSSWRAKAGGARVRRRPEPLLEPLSGSEVRVLRYLPTNLSAPEIARELSVSPNTVKTHIRHLYAKLGTHHRAEAVDLAGLEIRESVTVAGRAERARVARVFVGGVLGPGHPCGDDAALVVSGLFGNSVRHSRSGAAGGTVTVAVSAGDGLVRVEVADRGGPEVPEPYAAGRDR